MRKSKTYFVVAVGMFSAIAFLLQYIGSLMNINVAGFLEVEISDLPAIIISLALGPWAGVCVELVKNLLHCTISSTGFVGEFANFAVNGVFVFVCGQLYSKRKTKKGAVISLVGASVVMAVMSILINLFVMLPLYMPAVSFVDKLMLTLTTIAPFNLVRGLALALITILIYKKISRLLKGRN